MYSYIMYYIIIVIFVVSVNQKVFNFTIIAQYGRCNGRKSQIVFYSVLQSVKKNRYTTHVS